MSRLEAPHGASADTWLRIDADPSIGAARRSAAGLATGLGFGAERIGEVGIVVSELATNLVRHGRGGELVLRTYGTGADARLRVLAIDSGPGSRDIEALITDGASTRGTLGIGLGACVRLSTVFDVYSVPALGTVVLAELDPLTGSELAGPGRDDRPVERGAGGRARPSRSGASRPRVADLTRPLSGEGDCGDAAVSCTRNGRTLAMVADGLGHGPLAAEASRRAADVLLTSESTSPAALLQAMHGALAGTRGAAVSVISFDPVGGLVVHAGVGNVATRLMGGSTAKSLPSQPGIVGHRIPRVRELAHPVDVLADDGLVLMHSDGLTQRWSLDELPGVERHHPAVISAATLRGAATRRDDAGVLVLRTTSDPATPGDPPGSAGATGAAAASGEERP